MQKEFRNFKFLPLVIQATIDCIGSGFANLFAEFIIYLKFSTVIDYIENEEG